MAPHFGVLASVSLHGAPVDQVPLQVALLHERTVAVVAVEGPLSTMHAHVGLDAEQLGVGSPAGQALEELVGPPCGLVTSEYFLISSVHSLAVVPGRLDRLVVSRI